mmetsp:Transcript_3806/g.13582  ORF Transcript_3806/g.13582 Transcript_3806/m.13582 type:complete len:339 (+) Transcript_3806:123-1139(+)
MGGAGHEEGETHAAAPAALPLASPEEDLPYEFYYEVGETLRPGEGDSLDVPQELSSGFTLSPSQPWTEDSVSVGVLQRVREHVYKLLEEGSLSEADLQHLLDCAMSVGFPDTSAIRCQSPEMTPGRAPLSSEPLKRSLAVPWVMDGSDAEVPTSSLTKHDLLHLEGALLEMKRRLREAERDTREHRPRLSSQTVEARSPPSWTPGPCHTRLYHDAEYRKLRLASLQEQAEAREKRRAEQTLRSVRTSRSKTGTELPFLERVHLLMVKKKSEEDARRRLEEKRRRDEEAKLQKEPLRRSSQDILQHVAKLMSRHKASRARIESQHGAKLKVRFNLVMLS